MADTVSPSDLAYETEYGESERTPAIALTAVFIVISAVVAVVADIALILYHAP